METLVFDSIRRREYSEAASMERDIITYVKTKEKFITKASMATAKTQEEAKGGNLFGMMLVERYMALMFLEYAYRKNYGKVIELYKELASRYAHDVVGLLSVNVLEEENMCLPMNTKLLQILYELALIRTDKSHSNIPVVKSSIYREMKAEPKEYVVILKRNFVEALRASKEYDHAIDLEIKLLCLPNLLELEAFEAMASLFITYLERYCVEKHPVASKAYNYSLINEIFEITSLEYERTLVQNHGNLKQDLLLAFAQYSYLCHKLGDEQHTHNYIKRAINWVECIAMAKWKFRDHCFTCRQKCTAPTELQLVCSECQVSCYCDIDHQRASWMKNEVIGTRLGHKVFCPVLKAYRIWMGGTENADEERDAKMERRFKKECIAFLAYGLGLKDKCFEVKDLTSLESST